MIHQNHVPFENRDKYKREENIDHRTKWTTMKLIASLKIFSYFFFQRIISTSNHFLDRSCLHQILYKFYCDILSAMFDRSKICLEAKENLCEKRFDFEKESFYGTEWKDLHKSLNEMKLSLSIFNYRISKYCKMNVKLDSRKEEVFGFRFVYNILKNKCIIILIRISVINISYKKISENTLTCECILRAYLISRIDTVSLVVTLRSFVQFSSGISPMCIVKLHARFQIPRSNRSISIIYKYHVLIYCLRFEKM